MNEKRKRVDIVNIKMCREGSVLYRPRKISKPKDVVELIRYFLNERDREVFLVIALDTKNQPSAVNICSVGTVNSAIVHPREVFKMAILANATNIIIAHNHPSGIATPSSNDIKITKRLRDAGSILGIDILDHVIIGSDFNDEYYSFKENNI